MAAPIVPATGDLKAILINNDQQRTNNPVVDLILSAENATDMLISNTNDFAGASWETYVTAKEWILLDEIVGPAFGDGEKVVYVKFRSATLDESDIHSATIYLDTTPPSVGSLPIIINDGELVTNNRNVTLHLSAENATQVEVLNEIDQTSLTGTPMAYNDILPWTLSEGNGPKSVLVNFFDDIGNDTGFFSAEIRLIGQVPDQPNITEPSDGTITSDHFTTISGVGDPEGTIEIEIRDT